MSELTQALIRELVHYEPETGVFTWRERDRKWFTTLNSFAIWNSRFGGKQAGSVGNHGYTQIKILRRLYLAHRLAWFYQTGKWPPDQIDHIDMDRANTRWANLRLATHAENQRNTRVRNMNGFKGVYRNHEKWAARIMVDGKVMHLGVFMTPEGAALARRWAAERYHREFAS